MNKCRVNTIDCTSDYVLAEDIFSYNNVKFISKYTPINSYIKTKLLSNSINQIDVYKKDEYEKDTKRETVSKEQYYEEFKESYEETVLKLKGFIIGACNGKKINDEEMLNISQKIYDDIDRADFLIKYAGNIRDKDEYTFYHSVNVSFYGMLIAKWMNLSEKQIREVISAGLLHDLGKTKIKNSILNKPGRLTDEEFEEMKKHPLYGYEIIKDDPTINDDIKNVILQHHERINGTGYPYGIKADEMGLYSRIIAIADVYDAMTSDRVYKKKKSPFRAFEMFKTEGISIFDTDILRVFLNNINVYFIGAEVLLNDGRKGKIVYIPPNNLLKPILKLNSTYIDFSKDNGYSISEVIDM
ncbi:HD family phosphohydrolase [Clostridium acetobutylicum]|nr:HD family phosphohydrolase [Clostridium acetobutylicum]